MKIDQTITTQLAVVRLRESACCASHFRFSPFKTIPNL